MLKNRHPHNKQPRRTLQNWNLRNGRYLTETKPTSIRNARCSRLY
jgi:hypothetical protein